MTHGPTVHDSLAEAAAGAEVALRGASTDLSAPADPEVLRRKSGWWASVMTVVVTVWIVATGHQTPKWIITCGLALLLLHVFRLSRWARVGLLATAVVSIGPAIYYGLAAGETRAGPLYAMVVFTIVIYAQHMAAVGAVAVIVVAVGGAYEIWAVTSSDLGWSGFVLVVPSVLLLALCYSWRHSVLSEHARTQMGQTLANHNRMLRRALVVFDQLGAAEERARIAREIHDRVGHCLTSIHVYLEAAERHLAGGNEEATLAIGRALEATALGLREVRECVEHLRISNDALPFDERVRRAIERYALHERVELVIEGELPSVPRRRQEVLLRCLQEALTNAARHADASRILVRLRGEPSRVELSIQDDGRGCSMVREGFGLLGMRERVVDLGGDIDIQSAPGAGFTVRVSFRSGDAS